MTGQLIVPAIIDGQRDPGKLAELSHPRIQASRAEIARSLEGTWLLLPCRDATAELPLSRLTASELHNISFACQDDRVWTG